MAVAGLLACMGAVQVTTMLNESQTWDEGIHLVAGYSYWRTGSYRMNPEHPPLAKMLCALPLLALGATFDPALADKQLQIAGLEFLYRNRLSPELMLGAARGVAVLLTLLFALWVAVWTRRRFGETAALIALALFCLDPNLIAHGRYVTTDVIAAGFIFAAATLWIDYLESPSWRLAVFAGLALGCALTSKFSALFLVPLMAAAGLWKKRTAGTLVLTAVAGAVILLVYAPEIANLSHAERLRPHLTGTGRMAEGLVYLAERFNLPANSFMVGLDRLSEHNARGHPGYLLGHVAGEGLWYYFPVAMLVKTPVATLIAIAAGVLLFWKRREGRFALTGVAVTAGVFFAFALASRINIGHRHILPVYAFLFVLAGVVLARHKRAAIVLAAGLAVESAAIYPFYLSFFNIAAGGPSNGHKYLLDSNLDWGQDAIRLGQWVKKNGLTSICFCYFGNTDLVRYVGNVANFAPNPVDSDCIGAVSATPLYGLYVGEEFSALRNRKPLARIGYSIYVYDLRKK